MSLMWVKLPEDNEAGECSDLLGHAWDIKDESGDGWKHAVVVCRKCNQVIDYWQRERPMSIEREGKRRSASKMESEGEQ